MLLKLVYNSLLEYPLLAESLYLLKLLLPHVLNRHQVLCLIHLKPHLLLQRCFPWNSSAVPIRGFGKQWRLILYGLLLIRRCRLLLRDLLLVEVSLIVGAEPFEVGLARRLEGGQGVIHI